MTTKDLYDILENRISNEAQKAFIRNNFPLHIAEEMCDAIDRKEKAEHFKRFLMEYNGWMVNQQKCIQQFLHDYNR